MVIQVLVQSGSGGGLLTIVTVALDRINFGSAVQVQAQLYEAVRGDTTTPQTSVFVRRGVQSWTDTFTAVAIGPSNDLVYPARDWVILVKDPPANIVSWTVTLEVSMDNTFWETILTHATADGINTYKRVENKWAYYMRMRVTALNLGIAPNVIVQVGGFV